VCGLDPRNSSTHQGNATLAKDRNIDFQLLRPNLQNQLQQQVGLRESRRNDGGHPSPATIVHSRIHFIKNQSSTFRTRLNCLMYQTKKRAS